MTMHLIRGITSLNTKKRTSKINMVQMEVDFKAYNKDLRRRGLAHMQFSTLKDFIDHRYGRLKATEVAKKSTSTKSYTPPKSFVRETVYIPSLDTMQGTTERKESPKYSGDYVIGIATMHKSNLVPVGRGDSPVNYATMRRN